MPSTITKLPAADASDKVGLIPRILNELPATTPPDVKEALIANLSKVVCPFIRP